MYFDHSTKKLTSLAAMLLALGFFVTTSLTTLVQNETTLAALSNLSSRMHGALSYAFLYKVPYESARALAAGATGPDTSLPTGPVLGSRAVSIPVLLYHGENGGPSMSTATFVSQLRTLAEAGWHTVTLSQFDAFMKKGVALPDKSFLLTFDDGRRDTFYIADPVLNDLHFTAVMFVITGLSLPDNGPHAVNNFYLSKSELAYMAQSGRWELESHGDQDHRGYMVPTATSTAENVSFQQSQHFLSNRFWIPNDARFETPTEYQKRITDDLLHSKQLLEQDFGSPVLAYAYPFNDFGEDTVNFPESTGRIAQAVKGLYTYAFYQTWDGNGDSFNYPDKNATMIKRIEPLATWTGEDLLHLLQNAQAKNLPYQTDGFNNGWQTNWGIVLPGNTLTLKAASSTTGAAAFLDGTEAWKDYRITVTASITAGTLSLIARHTETDTPYLVCAFSDDRIYLERHSGETQTTLAVARYQPSTGPRKVTMSVRGTTASCAAENVSVHTSIPTTSQSGGIGVSIWTPEAGSAEARVTALSATGL